MLVMKNEIKNDLVLRHEMLKRTAKALKEQQKLVKLDYDGRLLTIYATETKKSQEKPIFQVRLENKDEKIKLKIMFEMPEGTASTELKDTDHTLDEMFDNVAEFIEDYTEGWCEEFSNGKLRWNWLGD